MSGMFEYIAATDDSHRVAGRKALALARARATRRFASFLDSGDREARLALVAGDLAETVKQACADCEYDDYEGVLATVQEHLGAHVVAVRRPKMCPVHREITDISLQQGDPQAGFSAMAQHMFGEQSCRGAYDGRCNFKPEMATQSYWDQKEEQRKDRAEQRQRDQQQALQLAPEPELDADGFSEDEFVDPEVSNELDTPASQESHDWGTAQMDNDLSPAPAMAMAASVRKAAHVPNAIMHSHTFGGLDLIESNRPGVAVNGMPYQDFKQHWEASGKPWNMDVEVTHPSRTLERVCAGVLGVGHDGPVHQFLADQRARRQQPRTAEALKTVDVDSGSATAEPVMNKDTWTGTPEVDTEMSGTPHPTVHQDIAQPALYKGDGYSTEDDGRFEQTDAVLEHQDVTQSGGIGNGTGGTFSNPGYKAVSAVDPDKNPIRESMEAEFASEDDVAQAIRNYKGE